MRTICERTARTFASYTAPPSHPPSALLSLPLFFSRAYVTQLHDIRACVRTRLPMPEMAFCMRKTARSPSVCLFFSSVRDTLSSFLCVRARACVALLCFAIVSPANGMGYEERATYDSTLLHTHGAECLSTRTQAIHETTTALRCERARQVRARDPCAHFALGLGRRARTCLLCKLVIPCACTPATK